MNFYKLKEDELTVDALSKIIEKWKEAVVTLDKMVYHDARKEFSLSSKTGFGVDGAQLEMEHDFEQVRGDFESSPFVTAVLRHIQAKTELGDSTIEMLQQLRVGGK